MLGCRSQIFGSLYAFSLLINGFVTKPYYSLDVQVNTLTIPIFSIGVIILFRRRLSYRKHDVFLLIPLVLSFVLNIAIGSVFWIKVGLHLSSGILLLGLLSSQTKAVYFTRGFIVTFALLCLAIYIFRYNKYNGDLIRVRSGINIWGGNVLYMFSILGALIGQKQDRILYKLSLIIAITSSFLFINRLSIVLSLFLLFVLQSYKWRLFSLSSLIFLLPMLLKQFENLALLEAIAFRFSSGDATETRVSIWNEAIAIWFRHPLFGTGLGSYGTLGSQTSAHSLPLNILAESGVIIGGIILVLLCVKYILLLVNSTSKEGRIRFALHCVVLFVASIAGEKFIQVSGYGNSMMLVLFLLSMRKPNLIRYGSETRSKLYYI